MSNTNESVQGVHPPKPFIRWAGSKRKLLPVLRQYWKPSYKRYIEPFAGSACLFFELMPNKAVLSDNNKDLIETYNVIKSFPDLVHEAAHAIPIGKDNYYSVRSLKLDDLSPIERAARFIFLNRYCFNGLYRTNAKGEFNVPYSPSKTGGIPSLGSFRAASFALQRADVMHASFETVLELAEDGDFVYLDPPYAVKNSRIFNQYGPDTFGLYDLEKLSCMLESLNGRGVHFMLSYAAVPEATLLFKKWHLEVVKTQRNIAGFTKFRRIEEEIIATNFC